MRICFLKMIRDYIWDFYKNNFDKSKEIVNYIRKGIIIGGVSRYS